MYYSSTFIQLACVGNFVKANDETQVTSSLFELILC